MLQHSMIMYQSNPRPPSPHPWAFDQWLTPHRNVSMGSTHEKTLLTAKALYKQTIQTTLSLGYLFFPSPEVRERERDPGLIWSRVSWLMLCTCVHRFYVWKWFIQTKVNEQCARIALLSFNNFVSV